MWWQFFPVTFRWPPDNRNGLCCLILQSVGYGDVQAVPTTRTVGTPLTAILLISTRALNELAK